MWSVIRRPFVSIAFCVISLVLLPSTAHAENQNRFTLILNQVRGPECCDPGNIRWFKEQQSILQKLDLVGNFALRYDAVLDETYAKAVLADQHNHYGALLEVTPRLASDAGVGYTGTLERWYEAQTVYLIGYTQQDRKKIIDTYMKAYQKAFKSTPRFSSSWMIDAWSLSYLREEYGVVAHQLTREQYGTDSYTLYGGPAHYPYYPSTNWGMVPQPNNQSMPLILRQTIMDPVYNYGDTTNSYTSQPNDYFLRKDTIAYFRHLFSQAHTQSNPYTIAVLGLENTMAEPAQLEFFDQLREVRKWKESSPANTVPSVSQFAEWHALNQVNMTSYAGKAQNNPSEQAWFINTPKYRARIRLTNSKLILTDLRLYDTKFEDPYLSNTAKSLGWWIIPFALDSSRFNVSNLAGTSVINDTIISSKKNPSPLQYITLTQQVKQSSITTENEGSQRRKVLRADDKVIAVFTEDQIELQAEPNLEMLQTLPIPLQSLQWKDQVNTTARWGFEIEGSKLKPFVNVSNLEEARQLQHHLLFPEKRFDPISSKKTYVYINNQFAISGRNPIRLILHPRNAAGDGVLLSEKPTVSLSTPVDSLSVQVKPQDNNSVWIELHHSTPITTNVTIRLQAFEKTVPVYFAPNCKNDLAHCITHPIHSWWYVRNAWSDFQRGD